MVGMVTDGEIGASGHKTAEPSRRAPEPLGNLIDKIDRAVVDLAKGEDGREALHALRSGLSDICALTEGDPEILRAVDRVVSAGDHLAEMVMASPSTRRSGAPPSRLNAARRALAHLDGKLVKARPSQIAVSLGRGW